MATRLLAGISCLLSSVEGHMHQQIPVSRQYGRSRDFHNSTFEDLERVPYAYNAGGVKEIQERATNRTDPAVLAEHGDGVLFPLYYSDLAENGNYLEPEEIAVRKGVCGDPRLGEAPTKNTYSTPSSEWPVVAGYESGQVVEMDIVVVYFHWGHLEFFLCNVEDLDDPDGVVTQECLNKYPLSRAPDIDSGGPIDPSYPGRYYLDPPCRKDEVEQNISSNFMSDSYEAYNVKMRYVFPDIECEHCVLQMHYMTGNRCKHIGYDEFDPPSWNSACAPNKTDWVPTDMGVCGVAMSYPEEFWACSDIKLTAGTTQAPSTAAEATPNATDTPTLDSAASAPPTPSPTAIPTADLAAALPSATPTQANRSVASSVAPTATPTTTTSATPTSTPSSAGAIEANPSDSDGATRFDTVPSTLLIGLVLLVGCLNAAAG